MSGGIAWVLDERGDFESCCNQEMVDLEPLGDEEELIVSLIRRHAALTGSTVALRVLRDWSDVRHRGVQVMPRDYKRALSAAARLDAASRDPLSAARADSGQRWASASQRLAAASLNPLPQTGIPVA